MKGCFRMVGLMDQYAPHSTRAGLITEAAEAGVHQWVIAAQSGHRAWRCCAATSAGATFSRRTPAFRSTSERVHARRYLPNLSFTDPSSQRVVVEAGTAEEPRWERGPPGSTNSRPGATRTSR